MGRKLRGNIEMEGDKRGIVELRISHPQVQNRTLSRFLASHQAPITEGKDFSKGTPMKTFIMFFINQSPISNIMRLISLFIKN